MSCDDVEPKLPDIAVLLLYILNTTKLQTREQNLIPRTKHGPCCTIGNIELSDGNTMTSTQGQSRPENTGLRCRACTCCTLTPCPVSCAPYRLCAAALTSALGLVLLYCAVDTLSGVQPKYTLRHALDKKIHTQIPIFAHFHPFSEK